MRTITPVTLNMLQVRANRVCTRIFHFSFRKRSGKSEVIFLPMSEIQLKRVNHKLGRRTNDVPSTGRFCEAPPAAVRKVSFSMAKSKKKGKLRG